VSETPARRTGAPIRGAWRTRSGDQGGDPATQRPRRGSPARLLTVVVTLALALGLAQAPGAVAGEEPPASTITTDWRKDPHLDAEQKALLSELAERSSEPLRAESWAHAGTVGRLELAVPSGLPADAPIQEHALAFAGRAAALWKLGDVGRLRVTASVAAGDCSTVVLQLDHPSGLAVYNAVLSVVVTPDGVIRGAAGRLTGEKLAEAGEPRLDADGATKVLRRYLAKRGGKDAAGIELPTPTEVVLDPFFIDDGDHQGGRGWSFTADPRGGEPGAKAAGVTGGPTTGLSGTGGFVVAQQTATVTVSGPGINLPNQQIAGCPDANAAKGLPEIVLDPMTRTPALVGLGHLNVTTSGATATEQAYDLLSRSFMADLYGDLDPRRHLENPREIPGAGGRTHVRFQEYYAGYPVDGAYLTVTLLANGTAETVTGRFVYFPSPLTTPTVTSASALTATLNRYLDLECGTDAACRGQAAAEHAASPPTPSLVVLSAEVYEGTTIPAGGERLAWRVDFPRRTIYWDAIAGQELFGFATVDDAIPHTIQNIELKNQIEITDGTPTSGITPHADATRVSNLLGTVDAFYTALGRNSFDNNGTRVIVGVRHPDDNAYWCRNPGLTGCMGQNAQFGWRFVAGDIVGHEFTHGVVATSAMLSGGGEPSALNEHYGDVMGNLIFPDGNAPTATDWKVGEDSTYGAFRDMAHPGLFNQPEHYGMMRNFCNDPLGCAHSWDGIPNKAAVLIAQGGVPGSSHPGVGRDSLARLYFDTLTTLMGPSDLFLEEQVNTVVTCRALASAGTAVAGRPITRADCDHVVRAFNVVGVSPVAEYGWTRFGTGWGGTGIDVAARSGQRLFNGCTITDHILRGVDKSGATKTSDVADGNLIDFNGEWGSYVTRRGAATDPTDRSVDYRVWSTWMDGGVVDVDEVLDIPNGVGEDECKAPAGGTRRQFYSTQYVARGAVFLNGDKGTWAINANRFLPVGCTVETVRGLHYHSGVPEGAPAQWVNDGGAHGFDVTPLKPTNQFALDVNLHWWHTGTSGIYARVVYDIIEFSGANCLVTGLQPTP
jgi:Zn-dependent metalloprotease